MRKIRINELARELEVKPNRILELLPGLGVSEKKTHSSSIDEDVALQVRKLLGFDAPPPGEGGAGEESGGGEEHYLGAHEEETAAEAEMHEAAPALLRPMYAPAPSSALAEAETASGAAGTAVAEEQPVAAHDAQTPAAPLAARAPLRPPLMGERGSGSPIHAPVAPPAVLPSQTQPPPQPATHPQVQHPQPPAAITIPSRPAPPPAQIAPGMPIASPARPAPPPSRTVSSPRPGQILSGPRQPMPSESLRAPLSPGGSRPGAPAPPPPPAPHAPPAAAATPSQPRSAVPQRPMAPRPQLPQSAPPSRQMTPPSAVIAGGGSATPGQPAPRPAGPGRPTLAGQPAARPVVPPRPDLVARLQQQTTKPAPGAPRPGPPAPGQPIYRGPIRPGQPIARAPGAPTPGQPGTGPGGSRGGLRSRPMHPTSPMRIEPASAVPATTDQRRHAAKPGARPGERTREMEIEGKLRMPSRREQASAPPPIDREITISEGITVKELSEKLGIKANLVVKKLVEKKVFATVNQTLDVKLAEEVARAFGASTNKVSYEQETTQELDVQEVAKDLVKRPPVVTIMGHVDHGKTSLLDAIRETNVAAREAGGITQHIGAYHVEKDGRTIVFIDTPGHEAFTRMRARGAKVTDIVVLVVAADDGVMPQTIEAIDHARAAKVPIVVAINKIDKPEAQIDRIKQQLTDRGLMPEEWGGDAVMVPVSARAKTNLDLLLEMILLVADMQDLRANPDRPAIGSVLEAKLDRGRGPVATVLVRNGTLHVGDYFICGQVFGRVRAMFDDRGAPVRDAAPSMPVEVLGLESLPEVGDAYQVVTDTAKAKQIVIYREGKAREQSLARGARMTLDQLHAQLTEGEVKDLNLILKTDVGGTAEVLSDTLLKLTGDKVRVNVLRAGVGAINESDVLLASASNAIIIGFNVRPERNAQATAEQEKVDIRLHSIIYEVTDEIKRAMSGLLAPVFKEVYRGRAEVREVFRISKVGTVAGCMVQDGVLTRDSQVRLLRDNIVVHTGRIDSLKRFKNDASEVKQGFECGVGLANYNDVKPSDVIEAFVTERVAGELT